MKFDIRNQTRRTDLWRCLFILRATYYAMTVKKKSNCNTEEGKKNTDINPRPVERFVLNMALKNIESGLSKHK